MATRKFQIEQLSSLSIEQVKTLTADKLSSMEILKQISCDPMDPAWKARMDENKTSSKYITKYKLLISRLLYIGGEEVLIPGGYEKDYENIVKYGQLWSGQGSVLMKGEPCHCHSNASNLWEQNKDKTVICTGYALSKDGLWRQHSWLVWLKPRVNKIVETTVPRVAYYGFAMTTEMSGEFAGENY